MEGDYWLLADRLHLMERFWGNFQVANATI
jgi:hypothetical protein